MDRGRAATFSAEEGGKGGLTKQTKTKAELESMIMDKLRTYEECASVTSVNVVAEGASWRINFSAHDDEKLCGRQINDVEEKLRAMYDLGDG